MFGATYARWYDTFYADKDAGSEVDALLDLALHRGLVMGGSVLDVGCGTGRHIGIVATRGYRASGTDTSPAMLDRAGALFGSAVDFRPPQETMGPFDLVYSLFDVLSYQCAAADAMGFMRRLADWTKPGGIVVVDCWHLAGVLGTRPEPREVRFMDAAGSSLVRSVTPDLDPVTGITTVGYSLREEGAAVTVETHRLRAFSALELDLLTTAAGLVVERVTPANRYDTELTADDWHMAVVARKPAT